jgi:hypothetical protein
MHKILIITIFLSLSFELQSQTIKRFDYRQMGSSHLATPIFDNKKPDGKEGRPTWSDDKYITDLFNNVIGKVLSKEKRDSLHLGTTIVFIFNTIGDVINCKFFVSYKDTTLINETDLYNLYSGLRKIKIDMSKVMIVPDYNTEWKYGDYATIYVSMISKESRDKLNKKNEDNILKKPR